MPTLSPRSTDEIEDTLERAAASAVERQHRKKARQTRIIVLAVIGALLLHALLIPLLAWLVSHWPRKPLPPGQRAVPLFAHPHRRGRASKTDARPEAAVRLFRTCAPPGTKRPTRRSRTRISISDQNTKAGSELPADASKPPLPTLQGREDPRLRFRHAALSSRQGSVRGSLVRLAGQPAGHGQLPQPDPAAGPQDEGTGLQVQDPPARRHLAHADARARRRTGRGQGTALSGRQAAAPGGDPLRHAPAAGSQKQSSQPPRPASAVNSVSSIGQQRPPGYQPQTHPERR